MLKGYFWQISVLTKAKDNISLKQKSLTQKVKTMIYDTAATGR